MSRSYIPQAITWAVGGVGLGATLPMVGLDGLAVSAGVGGLAMGAGVGALGYRRKLREEITTACQEALAPLIGPDSSVAFTRWTGWPGAPRKSIIRYSPTAKDDDPAWTTAVNDVVSRRLGITTRASKHDRRKRKLILVAAENTHQDLDPDWERMSRTIGDLMGKDAGITKLVRSDDGEVNRVEVAAIPTTKLAVPGYRVKIERTFSAVHPGRWRCSWDLQQDRMHFEIRPDFPTIVRLPTADADPTRDVLSTYDRVVIPYGVDEDGNEVAWRPAIDPNLMVVGAPGTGKTVFEHGVLATVAQYGWPIWVLDGKAIEFIGWRTWPNIQLVASKVEEQIALITRAHELMEHRYQLINTGQASEDDFEPLMVFVDEWADFRANLLAWYPTAKGKGAPTKPTVLDKVASIARKGRTARIHLLFATQRPDADYFGGDMRDNFRARISMGRLSPQGAMMMWQDPNVGTAVPRGRRGRATTINDGNTPVEIQTYFVPDPRKARLRQDEEDLKHLDSLVPAQALQRHERLIIIPPDHDLEQEIPEYQAWCGADWTLASARPDLDPVKTKTPDRSRSREIASPMAMFGIGQRIGRVRDSGAFPPDIAGTEITERLEDTTQSMEFHEHGDFLEGYGVKASSHPMSLDIGDLVEIEENVWVTLDQEPSEDPLNPGAVALCWRDDEGNEGIHAVGWTDQVTVRRPHMEEAA